MTQDHYIELVGKVVRVADTLQNEPTGLSLKELSRRTGYAKSSLHRILHSLRRHGYIEQDSTGGTYRLGLQFLIVASGLTSRIGLVKMARPCLHELVDRFRETAFLAVMRGDRAVFVDSEEAPGELRLTSSLGEEVRFHATAAGKAMAAFFGENERAAILCSNHHDAPTAHTKTRPSDIARDWERVRRRGYAINNEETILGAVYLAAPLFDSRERVCASISVGLPKVRYSPQISKRIAAHLVDSCRRLSQELLATGYVHLTGSYADR